VESDRLLAVSKFKLSREAQTGYSSLGSGTNSRCSVENSSSNIRSVLAWVFVELVEATG